eukprot:TRINITY_DN8016_c0_g5_i1.p1 TRINITY_DN8016_c0_g5~~TRINITY_DN8016_c0_g5_i1.p1  ORF type:complete len:1093 (+),score=196.45 TRINITY_DN8016_c0_g5_i1:118-3396(+)
MSPYDAFECRRSNGGIRGPPKTALGGTADPPSSASEKASRLFSEVRDELPRLLRRMEHVSTTPTCQRSAQPVDLLRVEILGRLLELLAETSSSKVGVLQSTVVAMFTATLCEHAPAYFYTPMEIDQGCASGPTEPLSLAIDLGVDDRLVVTLETFEAIMFLIGNDELTQLLELYTDHVRAREMSWQVALIDTSCSSGGGQEDIRIKNATGIAVFGHFAYVSDASQHCIFQVNLLTDEVSLFCGKRGKLGLHDGPREMARFRDPSGLAVCEWTQTLYVCDTGNDAIRTISLPGGIVQTLPLSPVDPSIRLVTPISICVVCGDYDYDKEESEDDEDGENADGNGPLFTTLEDEEDDDAIGGRHVPLLEGITEEEDDSSLDHSRGQSAAGSRPVSRIRASGARYALETTVNSIPGGAALGGSLQKVPRVHGRLLGRAVETLGLSQRRPSGYTDVMTMSRRTSGYVSSMASRRTSAFASGYVSTLSVSSVSSRRTSTLYSRTPGDSAKDSLLECTEEDDGSGHSLAVTSDHCIYLVRPDKLDVLVLAGSPDEYGYKDAEKGADARFSSLKGITCIRNCLFVADHWNNVIRCINLKTRQVDTVMDFNPCGPIALAVSGSGSVFVLDSEFLHSCNMLKVCSLQTSSENGEGVLGTTMFQMIQESIGRSRASSRSSEADWGFIDGLSRRGSARGASRRNSAMSNGEADTEAAGAGQGGGRSQRSRGSCRRASAEGTGLREQQARGAAASNVAATVNPLTLHPNLPTRDAAGLSQRQVADHDPWQASQLSAMSSLPRVPRALRSMIPGASLHPALINMMLIGHGEKETPLRSMRNSAVSGSQFHVSVVSLGDGDDEVPGASREFFSFLNPKQTSPWQRIPIGTLQHVYAEATGQCCASTPQALVFWDAADCDAAAARAMRHTQQLLIGGSEQPPLLKVLAPKKGMPADTGRFRAVAVDMDRLVMADADSHQVFLVNHTKSTKEKIAGCGRAGCLDGPLDVCRMNRPASVALDPRTHYIYVADAGNHRIRCIDLSTGFMRTVCGNGVKGSRDGTHIGEQALDSPFDLHFMSPCYLIISCADNSIRRLDLHSSALDTILVGS